MAGVRASDDIEALFGRQQAPFVDRAEDSGIYPHVPSGKNEEAVHEAFENFYAVNATYDLTAQWITRPGPFVYDYRWLVSMGTESDMKSFGARHFEKVYGVHPDTVEIL